MVTRRWIRALWIGAAGSCIALGVGSGVASASSDSADSTGPSSAQSSSQQSSQSTEPAASSPSAEPEGDGKHGDSGAGASDVKGAAGADKPTSSVSAATVTVRRDEGSTSEVADHVTSTTPAVSAESGTAAAPPKVAAEQVVAEKETVQQPLEQTVPEKSTVDTTPAVLATPTEPAQDEARASEGSEPEATEQKSIEPQAAESAPAITANRSAAASVGLAAPASASAPARSAGPLVTLISDVLSAFGLLPPGPAVPAVITPISGTPSAPGVVTGVAVGHAPVQIPVGSSTYTGAADWYFPTQSNGTVQAQGVMWLQHGFLGDKAWNSALAQQLAQQTNSVVVVANIPSFPFFTCSGCTLNGVPMQQGVASLFADSDRLALNASATAAGYQGTLPTKFILTGHSAGGGLAAAAGGFYVDAVPTTTNDLLGVVMYDGVASNSTAFANAIASLDKRDIPVYQIAAPPQPWNANGQTTSDLVALRPGQFVGDVLANGSHVDSLIGGVPIIDLISQILIRPSPPGNTQAVYTLASGWIKDMYAGRGPGDRLYGTYGAPDQYVVLGQAAAVVLGPPPVVDVDRYLGTWYEVGSVKQFFSIGLVNTKAVYSLNPDGSIRVENSGNYFFDNGLQSRIVGAALPLNVENNKLNVAFFGPVSATPPGNYWIVDLAPDYSWAVVTDSTGSSGFLLSRTPIVTDALYQELLNRASAKGVKGTITRTRQPGAELGAIAV